MLLITDINFKSLMHFTCSEFFHSNVVQIYPITWLSLYVIVIPRYEYDIVVITRVRGEAEYEC